MSSVVTPPLPGTVLDARYPDSDGRFMGETDYHNLAMSDLRDKLEDRYADDPGVYVASNLILYYKEGDPNSRRDPDVLFAKKVGKHRRRSFRVWEEKKLPEVLWEIASRRTWRNDIGEKRVLYAELGIKEYFVFDPEARYIDPPLQGFRSVRGKSVPIKPNADGSLTSKEPGVRIIADGERVRLIDLKTGEIVLSRLDRADLEKERAEQEKQRAEQEKRRAEQESERAKQESRRAEEEEKRRAELAGEVERLRALLAKYENRVNPQTDPPPNP